MEVDFVKSKYGRWFESALLYFIVAAILGLLMRYARVGDLPELLDYRHIRHAHSHVALLGWLYAGLFLFIVYLYKLTGPIYSKLFWISQLCVLVMLVGFPVQGYKFFSIAALTIFIFQSYYFILSVFKDVRIQPDDQSKVFLWTSLVFLFLSSLGTWALSIMMATSLKGSAWYYGAIQFYLHFQFNGWLVFAVVALLVKFLNSKGIHFQVSQLKRFFWWLLVSAFITFAIAVTWSTPLSILFYINSIGVLIQLVALLYFIGLLRSVSAEIKEILDSRVYKLMYISLVSFILKIIIQTCVVIPYIATISYTIRNFVIGFIHLLMLGCISLFLIALYQDISKAKFSNGLNVFILGLLLSEFILFLQGLFLWASLGFLPFYYELLFTFSILMPVGLIIYIYKLKKASYIQP